MSQFPVIFPYSFGYDGPNALPLTFPVTFGIQFGDTDLTVTATPAANLSFASANGIALVAIAPASTASATRIANGFADPAVTVTTTAAMYWTMNVQTDNAITAGIPADAALSGVGGTVTAVTVGFPAELVLAANAETSLAATVGVTVPLAQELGLLDNLTTATASFAADAMLDAVGNTTLSGEAQFLANEQELGLLNGETVIGVGVVAGAALSGLADANTVGSAGFSANEVNGAAGFCDLAATAAATAAVTAAWSGNASHAVTVGSSGAVLRTCYGVASLSAAPATTGAVSAMWSGNAVASATATGMSDFNAAFRSWAECYGTAHVSGDIRRTQYAVLDKPGPPVFPYELPFTFGGIFVGETSVTTTASAILTRSIDAEVEVAAFPTVEINLSGLADTSLPVTAHRDELLHLHAYGYASQSAQADFATVINAALIGRASLQGVVFIEGAEDEQAFANANVAVLVALPAAAKLTGFMTADVTETVAFGDPVLSYPISAVPMAVTADPLVIAGIDHPAEAELVIIPASVPGQLTANFSANAKTVGTISTSEAMWVGYRIAAQLGITNQRTVDAIVGLIEAGLVVVAHGTVDATLQPLVNTQVTGWWHFPE